MLHQVLLVLEESLGALSSLPELRSYILAQRIYRIYSILPTKRCWTELVISYTSPSLLDMLADMFTAAIFTVTVPTQVAVAAGCPAKVAAAVAASTATTAPTAIFPRRRQRHRRRRAAQQAFPFRTGHERH